MMKESTKILRVGYSDDRDVDAFQVESILEAWINIVTEDKWIRSNELWLKARYVLISAEIPFDEIEPPISIIHDPLAVKAETLRTSWSGEYLLRVSRQLSHLGIAGFTARELRKKFGWEISFAQTRHFDPCVIAYSGERVKAEVVGAGFLKLDPLRKMIAVYGQSSSMSTDVQRALFPEVEKLVGELLKLSTGWKKIKIYKKAIGREDPRIGIVIPDPPSRTLFRI
jgi:hypothetical protein